MIVVGGETVAQLVLVRSGLNNRVQPTELVGQVMINWLVDVVSRPSHGGIRLGTSPDRTG